MEWQDAWKLHSRFTLMEAALLICGVNPAPFLEENSAENFPDNYHPVSSFLIQNLKKLEIQNVLEISPGAYAIEIFADPKTYMVSKDQIVSWLEETDLRPEFFFSETKKQSSIEDAFLNPNSSDFPPKLAAAIAAYKAVTSDPAYLDGRTPKQALEKWLEENGHVYGLVDADGTPNYEGIEQISKVGNWKPKGGVAKTRSRK